MPKEEDSMEEMVSMSLISPGNDGEERSIEPIPVDSEEPDERAKELLELAANFRPS